MDITAGFIFNWIIYFLIAEFTWETILKIRQLRVYQKHTHIPNELIGILSRENFNKARLYALDCSKFKLVQETFEFFLTLAELYFNIILPIWTLGGSTLVYFGYEAEKHEILQSAAYISFMQVITTIIALPFKIYKTFVLEEKHGFNKQTASFFIKDMIKGFIVKQLITTALICGMVYIVLVGGDYLFLYLWLFGMGTTFFLLTIYPEFIAPLFDKYTPLPEGELRTEIEKLAANLGFPLCKLYVVENSKRSAHSNAYFYGFYKNKRIVLFDTLLKDYTPINKKDDDAQEESSEKKGCDNNEVLAVLAHELGHWHFNHNTKNLVIFQFNMLLLFLFFQYSFRYRPVYEALGFYNSSPVLISFIILTQFVFRPYFLVFGFLSGILSRHFEFQADKFAKSLGRSNYLKRALMKLNSDNLGFPIYDPWYSKWNHSHPPLLERLQALDKDE